MKGAWRGFNTTIYERSRTTHNACTNYATLSPHNLPTLTCPSPSPSYDPLSCFLYNLSITIPDVDPIPVTGYEIYLTDLLASKFVISSIPSSYAGDYAISLSAEGVQATVGGTFEFRPTSHLNPLAFHGTITASVGVSKGGDTSSLQLTLSFPPTSDGYMAKSGNVTDATVAMHIDPTSMEFSDMSAFQHLLNLEAVDDLIASSLDPTINEAIQGLLDSQASIAMTALIRGLDDKILALVDKQPGPMPSLPVEELVKWGDAGRVEKALKKTQDLVNSHLDEGGCKGGRGINGLIRDKTGGEVTLPLGFNKTVEIPGLAALTVGVERVNVSGIDTLTNLTLLSPMGDYGFEVREYVGFVLSPQCCSDALRHTAFVTFLRSPLFLPLSPRPDTDPARPASSQCDGEGVCGC